MELNICHLYPDVLNLYGDNGNLLCLQQRLSWRGIGSTVTRLPIGETADFTKFDLFFIGGGQDFEQEVLLSDLSKGKAESIKSAIADGKVFLTVCGGYQMLGRSYTTWDGVTCDFIGAIDYETKGAKDRMIGNFAFNAARNPAAARWWDLKTTAARPTSAPAYSRWARCCPAPGTTGRTARRACGISTSSAPTATARSCRKTRTLPTPS